MKRTLRSLLATFLAVVMVFGAAPMGAIEQLTDLFAGFCIEASAAYYNGTCGDNLTWTLYTDTGVLSITGTGAMTDYSFGKAPWHSNASDIISVSLPSGLTSIGSCAFYQCGSLTSIGIPMGVTSIGNSAFHSCSSLTSITIPDSVTSISNSAFHFCTSLTTVTFGANSQLTSIGNSAFHSCSSLTSITIPDSVTSISNSAFHSCTSLTTVTFGTNSQLTSIGDYAFYSCTSLTSITIPTSVTSIGVSAFYYCRSLTSITVGTGNSKYSSDEYGVLYNKDKTTLMQYPAGNSRTSYTVTTSVTSIGDWAFDSCSSLTSIKIPTSVTSIGDRAFSECQRLTSIEIPASVTSIGSYAFYYCNSLTIITVETGNSKYSSDEKGVLYNKDKTTLIQYPKGNSRASYAIPTSVTSIGNYAFYSCQSLTSIEIPMSVTSIGNYAFYYCNKLTDVYYGGSEADREIIKIGSSNTSLTDAKWHYNSSMPKPVTGIAVDANFKSFELFADGTKQIEYTITPPDATDITVTFKSSNASVATVSATGLVTGVSAGTATITVTANDTTNGTISDTCTVTVKAVELQKVEVNTLPDDTEYFVGDTFNKTGLTLTATYNNGSTATIATNDITCTPTELNTVGAQTITASYGGKSCTFTVTVNAISVSLDITSLQLQYKNSSKLTATVFSTTSKTVTWKSSNDAVAAVDKNGNVTATGRGTATITATITNTDGTTATDSCTVTVSYAWWQWLIKIILFGWIWY